MKSTVQTTTTTTYEYTGEELRAILEEALRQRLGVFGKGVKMELDLDTGYDILRGGTVTVTTQKRP